MKDYKQKSTEEPQKMGTLGDMLNLKMDKKKSREWTEVPVQGMIYDG